MCDIARREAYRIAWSRVRQEYETGAMVVEAGLQAALYCQLRRGLPNDQIVVEPTWQQGGDIRHDLVVVSGEGTITDIFELKFVPQGYPCWENDIDRLLYYVGNEQNMMYPVGLNPRDGTWGRHLPVQGNCRLHFVAVGRHDAVAVNPTLIAERVPAVDPAVNFWSGPVGNCDAEWDIQFIPC